MSDSSTGKTLKYGLPAALAVAAAAWFVGSNMTTSPFLRPQGLHVKPVPSSAGRPYVPGSLKVERSSGVALAGHARLDVRTAPAPEAAPLGTEVSAAAIPAGDVARLGALRTEGGLPGEAARSQGLTTERGVPGEIARPASLDVVRGPAGERAPAIAVSVQGSGAVAASAPAPVTASAGSAGAEARRDTVAVGSGTPGADAVATLGLPYARPAQPGRPSTESFQDAGDYVYLLLTLAKAGRWLDLGREIERCGGKAESVKEEPPAGVRYPPTKFDYAGTVLFSSDPAAIAEQLRKLRFPQFGAPIVVVRDLSGDWRPACDVTFDAFKNGDKPLIGLCINQMSVGEMLRIPEFLRICAARSAGVIANYDLTAVNFLIRQDPLGVERGRRRVALALELIHRSVPGIPTWLATEVTFQTGWQDWIGAQDPERFTGVVSDGGWVSVALNQPGKIDDLFGRLRAGSPGKPVGIMLMSHHAFDVALDLGAPEDGGLRRILLDRIKSTGFTFVHTERTPQ